MPRKPQPNGKDPTVLTKRQQEAWDLFQEGLTQKAIGERMGGINDSSVRRLLREAKFKLEGGGVVYAGSPGKELIGDDDELGAEGLDIVTDPSLKRVRRALKEAGFKGTTLSTYMKRLQRERNSATLVARSVKTQDLATLVADRAHRVLESIDQRDIDEASLRDKATTVGILLDKRQLLRGEPTQILSVPERSKLNELIDVVVKEAQRRGLEIDATGDAPQILPPEGEDLVGSMPKYTAELIEQSRERSPE